MDDVLGKVLEKADEIRQREKAQLWKEQRGTGGMKNTAMFTDKFVGFSAEIWRSSGHLAAFFC